MSTEPPTVDSPEPQPTRALFSDGDGGYACPKCSTALETMDAVIDHVHDAHEPVREFALRWGGAR